MIYINLKDKLFNSKGSSLEKIMNIENLLGFKFPIALKEYLLLTGNENTLYEWGCDYHGTKDLITMRNLIYEDISWYKEKGFSIELGNIIPFFQFQDTFIYVTIEEGNENPPIYGFDIGDEPTIRKINETLSDYIYKRFEDIKLNE